MSEHVHDRLVAQQSDTELRRKAAKAVRRGLWTKEEVDVSRRWARRLACAFDAKNTEERR